MRYIRLEKSIKKLDREMEALKVASKYLSNKDEINSVREKLNQDRQKLADELYSEDSKSYFGYRAKIREMIGKELDENEQKSLLEDIKETFGRQCPNASKESSGLNGWLKLLDVECEWIENKESGWSTLKINCLGPSSK